MKNKTTSRLHAKELHEYLKENDVTTYFGVPDSLLSPFCSYLQKESFSNTITANEGNAIGGAIGHYLATGNIALVYMQNSGLSNALDPLTSLADRDVLSIPVILLISWRGEPGKNDEPQHIRPGAITLGLLDSAKIPHVILSSNPVKVQEQIAEARRDAMSNSRPYALILKEDTLEPTGDTPAELQLYAMTREIAIQAIADSLSTSDILVAGIGKTSRELSEYRDNTGGSHTNDILVTGGMGHASSIAHSIATQKTDRTVFCLDGDGAAIMHLGVLTTIGASSSGNFVHIILNNGKHDSVGGQPTLGFSIDFCAIAKACGYQSARMIETKDHIASAIAEARKSNGPAILEIRIRGGARKELSRPTISPSANKVMFMAMSTQ
jgi:phosphonopyruvate decarboxylase